jgi:peptidoglycan hydrolase CwlO-like protein
MDISKAVAILVLAVPSAALAQVSYSRAWIVEGRPLGSLCADREDSLYDRRAMLDREKADNDAELRAIEREGAVLEGELRQLDHTNVAAVEDYNARSDAHNRRVAAHNRRVAEMNAQVADLTADINDSSNYCTTRGWLWRVR